MEWLEEIDRSLVLLINGWNTPWLDEIMWYVSAKWTWIPLYFILLFLAWKKFNTKQLLLFIACVFLVVLISDQIALHAFKNVFLRYRPSHNTLLEPKLHFYQIRPGEYYQGGQYGFISSHASNFFGIAVFVGLALKQWYPKLMLLLILIACVVSFSRLYLGVHYLSDLLVGAVLGGLIALVVHRFVFTPFRNKLAN